MRDGDLERVRALPLFSGCSSDTFRALTGGAFLQRFPAGTTLLLEGDQVDFLYVLLDGIVELEGTWNDKETTLAILRPVSTFILAAVVLDANGLMSARSVERSDILMLSGAGIRRVMAQDPGFAITVAQEMAGCYRGLVRTLKNQKLRGGLERLANYLITQRIRQRQPAARVGIGFGIQTPEQVRAVLEVADCAIIGSALIEAQETGNLENYFRNIGQATTAGA